MNLNLIIPENETQDLLLSITKICEMLSQQTYKKPDETLKFVLTKSKELFHFNPPISIERFWMIGLIGLEVYSSICIISTTNNDFEHYTDNFDEFSFEELKYEIEEILIISDITPYHLECEKIGPRFFEA